MTEKEELEMKNNDKLFSNKNLESNEDGLLEEPNPDTITVYNMPEKEARKLIEDEKALNEENKRRETLRHKVIADFVIMCSEFLYEEFSRKLKEMENKSKFFSDMGE